MSEELNYELLCCSAIKEIKQLQAQLHALRWIPVGEELPEDGLDVWVCVGKWTDIAYYKPSDRDSLFVVFGKQGQYSLKGVTHWKPIILPEGK